MSTQFAAFMATSLDGFIARPDGAIDWLEVGAIAGEDFGYGQFYAEVTGLIMGSGTYAQVATFEPWPYPGKPVWVMSTRSLSLRPGCELVGTAVEAIVARCQAQQWQRAYIDGGQVIQSFLAAGYLHQLTITIVPVLLGAGRSLFGDRARWPQDIPLRLVASRSWPNGYVQQTYQVQPATPVSTAQNAPDS